MRHWWGIRHLRYARALWPLLSCTPHWGDPRWLAAYEARLVQVRRMAGAALLLPTLAFAQTTQVLLSWQDTVNTTQTGYLVERRVRQPSGSLSDWMTLATVDASQRAYTDAQPAAGVDNCYQVVTQSGNGPSAPSDQACVLVPAPPVVPVTGVSVTVTVTVGKGAR